jgi:hypothetical protein
MLHCGTSGPDACGGDASGPRRRRDSARHSRELSGRALDGHLHAPRSRARAMAVSPAGAAWNAGWGGGWGSDGSAGSGGAPGKPADDSLGRPRADGSADAARNAHKRRRSSGAHGDDERGASDALSDSDSGEVEDVTYELPLVRRRGNRAARARARRRGARRAASGTRRAASGERRPQHPCVASLPRMLTMRRATSRRSSRSCGTSRTLALPPTRWAAAAAWRRW